MRLNLEKKGSEVLNTGSQDKTQHNVASALEIDASTAHGSKVHITPESYTMATILDPLKINSRRSKLECPRFDGYDFLGWYMKVEQFFEAVGVEESDKVQLVMIHLDGKALQWHQRYMKAKGSLKEMQWSIYAGNMRARFHDTEFTDPMSELVSLKQTNSVEDYYEEFEALLNLLQLSDDYALSIFVSNLKPDISKSVRLFHPNTLTQALNIAKQIESLAYNIPRKPFVPYKQPITHSSPYPNTHLFPKPSYSTNSNNLPGLLPKPNLPANPYSNLPRPSTYTHSKAPYPKPEAVNTKFAKYPTREERDERRKRGLCMWCNQKFVPGHNCIRSQLYHNLVENTDEIRTEQEEFLDCMEEIDDVDRKEGTECYNPTISLHALIGTDGCQTMRLIGKIKRQPLILLIDSGSTHNFIDQAVAKRLRCLTKAVTGVSVTVANGEILKAQEVCELIKWETQGLTQFTDFLVLPLMGCDLVLGVQWLKTLGPITWDFTQLSMQFSLSHQLVILKGLRGGTVHYASKNQLSKLSTSASKGTCTLLLTESPTLQLMESQD